MYLLDDFSKYYVFSHKNPEVMEYQHNLDELKSQLQALNTELFKVGQSVHSSINQLNASIAKTAAQLDHEKQKEKRLSKIMHSTENSENGSDILVGDTKDVYNRQYYFNWMMLIGIAGVVGGASKLRQ